MRARPATRRRLGRAAVLGAGTMGSTIAAHLANAGVPSLLLDVAPPTLADDERRRGLHLESPQVRSRQARAGLERAAAAQPPAFFTPARSGLVTPGNLEDDLALIADADWIIEAVVEDLNVKQDLLARVERHRRAGAIVSTNTSGLPVTAIASKSAPEFRATFIGTHFFNPPRYMRLLELIPTAETEPAVVETVAAWGERVLGKGVVVAKDTPNFIANRIGTFSFLSTLRIMLALGLAVDEVDELTGPLIGRSRSATFRTADLTGLDVILRVVEHAFERLPDDEMHAVYRPPALLKELSARGWLGEKSGRGFYRREAGEVLALDHRTFEYRPRRRLATPALEAARAITDAGRRLAALLAMPDAYGEFLRQLVAAVIVYAARRVPEISDDVVSIDRAMRWGFGWEQGPFEQWDVLSAAGAADRLPTGTDGAMPDLMRLARPQEQGTFYRETPDGRRHLDARTGGYVDEPAAEDHIDLARLKRQGREIDANTGASLIDLGDGILCLEFHSKMNTIGEDIVAMGYRALERLREEFDGLVIGNHAPDFCAGANLMLVLLEAQDGNWDDLDLEIRRFQQLMAALRRSIAPVVAAPSGRTLGGGVEFCFAASQVQAAGETYMGMVETGVGLIPAGGGTMEMAKRAAAAVPDDVQADLLPVLRRAFETVAMAKVSTSAEDARRLGLLQPRDRVTMSADLVLADAKAAALTLARSGYRPLPPGRVRVLGTRGTSAIGTIVHIMRTGNHVTDHDVVVATNLAHVMCGGPVPEGTLVSEEYLLDLEREAFLSLLGTPRTQDRIRHLLKTGRPLRN
jgi:3-hydroxyacyl-CoA dehydrogenase